MMSSMGDLVSLFSGALLLFFSVLVMIAYSPKSKRSKPESTLALAIFLGFMAAAFNTLYWQVFGQIAVMIDLISVKNLRMIGDILDLVFKGGAAYAGYLHLRALQLSLPSNERKYWSVLEMPFYPQKMLCLKNGLRRGNDEGKDS